MVTRATPWFASAPVGIIWQILSPITHFPDSRINWITAARMTSAAGTVKLQVYPKFSILAWPVAATLNQIPQTFWRVGPPQFRSGPRGLRYCFWICCKSSHMTTITPVILTSSICLVYTGISWVAASPMTVNNLRERWLVALSIGL